MLEGKLRERGRDGEGGGGRGGRGKEGKEIEGGWLNYSTQLIFNDNEYFRIIILTVYACSHTQELW